MTKAIMVQGTMSNAGKSLLVAGLCRIFAEDGYRVAPFKSQNMALNSYVTADGLEMGRAQVMQAEAAGVEPDVAMNPILLKPTSDQGSQVIVNGEVMGTMPAADYFAYKKNLQPQVMQAYESLAARHDMIVLEGAGSPAEINLKGADIVNMGMAKLAAAPVLLAGDIDLGGVFAQLYGTLQLLEAEERAMVKGLIINKFRGDVEILRPGLQQLAALCAKPVVGVVPYLKLDLDDEDSLAPRLQQRNPDKPLDVAVVRLPHLANFTDFNALSRHPAVSLRYVEKAAELGRPDLLILPGTKNTMADLGWLREAGLAACVIALARAGTPTVGICGGYQMLGQHLADPEGVETGGEQPGLGLLPLRTVFSGAKTRTRATGRLCVENGCFAPLDGTPLVGYEIHMGATEHDCPAASLLTVAGEEKPDGAVQDNVLGSYLHGLFDTPQMVEGLVRLLLEVRGLPYQAGGTLPLAEQKEQQYSLLARELRAALDMEQIYAILEAGL